MLRMMFAAVFGFGVGAAGMALALDDGVYQVGEKPGWGGQMSVSGDSLDIQMYASASGCIGHFVGTIHRLPGSDEWTAQSDPATFEGIACTLRGDSNGFTADFDACRPLSGARCAFGEETFSAVSAPADAAGQSQDAALPPTAQRWTRMLKTYFDNHYSSQNALYKAQVLLTLTGYGQLRPDGQWGPQTEAAFYNVADTIVTIGFEEPANADPQAIAGIVIGWMLDLVRAEMLQGDLPD